MVVGTPYKSGAEIITGKVDMTHETVANPNQSAERTRCREFGLFDAMILLAGMALSLSTGAYLLVFLANQFGRLCAVATAYRMDLFYDWRSFWSQTHDHLRNTLWYGFQVAEIFLFGMMPAFLLVRMRRPRPSLRALLRQPGMVAALAIVFGVFWVTGFVHIMFPNQANAGTAAGISAGGTVAVAWCLLAMSRMWESEPGWVDRVGRLLGCAAIGTALVGLIIFRI
jgi:hypothetical protein